MEININDAIPFDEVYLEDFLDEELDIFDSKENEHYCPECASSLLEETNELLKEMLLTNKNEERVICPHCKMTIILRSNGCFYLCEDSDNYNEDFAEFIWF